jgi:hypothetical protein
VWLPTAKNADGLHAAAGRVAKHSVHPPEVKVTVPVAAAGSPVSARVELVPKGALDGLALAMNDVGASPTVSDVDAVEPA